MESQLPHANDQQEIGHHDDHNEDGHLGEEKKSVFKRFKNKARKLKNTITKHGHGQDHQDDEPQHDEDDDDDEDEDETVEEPEQHGAPMYDSPLGGPDPAVAQPKDNLEKPPVIAEDPYTKPVASHDQPPTVPAGSYGTSLSEQSELGDQKVDPEKWKSKFEQPTGMEKEVPFAPSPTRVPTPVTENTYEGKEAGLSQVQHSIDKMGIDDSGTERKRFDPEHPDNLPRDTLVGNQSTQSSSYTEMISSMASSIASKLGYGEQPTTPESHENVKNSGSTTTDQGLGLTDKVTETSAPVNEKVPDHDGNAL